MKKLHLVEYYCDTEAGESIRFAWVRGDSLAEIEAKMNTRRTPGSEKAAPGFVYIITCVEQPAIVPLVGYPLAPLILY